MTNSTASSARLLDHVVLPVSSLAVARKRFVDLGFIVQLDAHHTFGSCNCMVNFANGTFIEPLAICNAELAKEHEQAGNTFLRRDKAFRYRHGDNGFSMLVFGDEKPTEAKIEFEANGIDTGNLVTVERPGVKVDLGFGMDPRSPDMTSFLCQRTDGPSQFGAEQTDHSNSAIRVSSITMVHETPNDFQHYISIVSNCNHSEPDAGGINFDLPNCNLIILTPAEASKRYGANAVSTDRGLRLFALDVEVSSLKTVSSVLTRNEIEHQKIGTRIVVPASNGQGAPIGFLEG